MVDLLVIGDANPDVIVGPLTEPLAFGQQEQLVASGSLVLGGSGAITACGAARLGLSVAIAGRIGDDGAGRFVLDSLASRGVDTSALVVDPALPTPLTVVVTRDDDRAMLTAGVGAAFDVPRALLVSARHVHVSSYFLMPPMAAVLPRLLEEARAHGATTSLDTNDDPSGEWDVGAMLDAVDVLLPNAREALRLSGADSVSAAAEVLATRVPVVAVKNGAAGAFCHNGRKVLHNKGIAVSAVDTVGAGDSFAAGFIAARSHGLSVERSLDVATVCGALSTRDVGGTAAQPTWDDVMSHLEGTQA
ncbi:carbohydrate kinase family protein [Actinophytocola oryzae]|uniref:Sugar/nucleoside kinase (Ribokinase family) n=1 Tax=Actinophytocola oryzae TaxID=502181 RepID=A0A4R7VZD6_9PSEU|nr:carbohydrate kinase family protein [Actinophytocola oryzae]TDV54919.1 sugar/nucleoside kinase (ribokinase family) [Actinophytocola oryzae]